MRSMSALVSAAPEPGMSSWIDAPAELDAPVVEPQVPSLHLDRAQADPAALALYDAVAVAEREARGVEARPVGGPQLRGWNRHRELHAPALRALVRKAEGALDDAPAGRAQAHLERRLDRVLAAPLEHPVEEQVGLAPARRPLAAHPRHRAEVLDVRRPGGHQLHRADDPVPVPPGLGYVGVLAAVHDHHQRVRPARTQPARRHREGRVGVEVPADPLPVQVHAGVPAHALEADQPAEAPGCGRALERDPVTPHRPRKQRGERAAVEDARHVRRPPGARCLRGAARWGWRHGGSLSLRSGLLRRGRLGQGGRGGLEAHLPATRQGPLGGHRLLGRRGGRQRQEREGGGDRRCPRHEGSTVAFPA